MNGVHEFSAETLDGSVRQLSDYRSKVLLIVNTASQCGFTGQYAGLESLYRRYHGQGLEVLGFPCNQFGNQEPGGAEEIEEFCRSQYKVSFPLFAKIDVNGATAHPLFQYLKAAAPGIMGSKAIKWNFTKFLVKKDGTVYRRYAPKTEPGELVTDVEILLADPIGSP